MEIVSGMVKIIGILFKIAAAGASIYFCILIAADAMRGLEPRWK